MSNQRADRSENLLVSSSSWQVICKTIGIRLELKFKLNVKLKGIQVGEFWPFPLHRHHHCQQVICNTIGIINQATGVKFRSLFHQALSVSISHEQALAGSRFSIPGFSGRDFAKSRDPGIFRDGIYPYFQSRDCQEIFPGFLFLLRVLVKSHHFHQSLSLSLSPPLRDAPLLPINSR